MAQQLKPALLFSVPTWWLPHAHGALTYKAAKFPCTQTNVKLYYYLLYAIFSLLHFLIYIHLYFIYF